LHEDRELSFEVGSLLKERNKRVCVYERGWQRQLGP
jgi:hypothetical protein